MPVLVHFYKSDSQVESLGIFHQLVQISYDEFLQLIISFICSNIYEEIMTVLEKRRYFSSFSFDCVKITYQKAFND